ncbi:MAG: 2-oxopent-4-enoate hydratase [Acidimicrobiales bacterium]|nr:2-oxopent-4-enoate hydratase [Acidimicrobiales bacterium]
MVDELMDHAELAAELFDAQRRRAGVELLSARFPDLDWEDARRIARATDDLRRADGEVQIGFKLGWTSTAMREALGIDRPNWGTLWDRQVCAHTLLLDRLIHPKVEPELVCRTAQDLRGEVSATDVAESGVSWALGLEVVDPRFPSFEFEALDNTADNSSSAAVVLGEFVVLDADTIRSVEVSFTDGAETRIGAASNAMGSPLEAVAWFVGELDAEGSVLPAGSIVFTGGLTAPFDVRPGSTYEVSAGFAAPVVLAAE